ncbi:MAG TPA: EAL domain-containing protein [Candidatus Sulfotelmatobacter sp.]|nr:EAL domain-containing protein [Candidatus Sulfotelmatobacter sp.]
MLDTINILVIEDVPADFMLVQRHLQKQGVSGRFWRVDSQPALEKALEAGHWDLLLSDYNVPGMDIRETLGFLRVFWPDLPIILISGSVGEEEAVELLKLGTWDFILKDRLGRLLPAIERALAEVAERVARQTIEQALSLSQERFQLAMRGANDGLWDWNLEENKVYFSPRWKAMLGYDATELDETPLTWINLLHPDDCAATQNRMSRFLLSTSDRIEFEFRMRHKDGSYRDILSRAFLMRDKESVAKRLVGTHVDITERKNSELKLKLASTVFVNTQEGVFVTDPQGNFLAINPAFTAITEYAEEEALGSNVRLLQSGKQERSFYQAMWRELLATGTWQGEIWNRRKSGEIYPQWLSISAVHDEAETLLNYVGVFSDLSRIKQSEADLHHLAHHDPLTGLPNRLLLRSRLDHALERASREKRQCAVLFIDLDHFKVVNDSLGHRCGDELLQTAGNRLKERLRDIDTLARLGGDEFIVVLDEVEHAEDAASVAQDLINRLNTPFRLSAGHEIRLGGSVGISLYPGDGETAELLIQHADSALYQAKEAGRNVYKFYTKALTALANERLQMEVGLHRALEEKEFVLHYQPVVGPNGRIDGVEALIRWASKSNGLVPPGRFIPIAEETGLIIPLGEWVLREACVQMKQWLDLGYKLETMAINLSPRQFHEENLDRKIESILAETSLPARYVELEITESALMGQGDKAEEQLSSLKNLGLRLSIDDFGTGYSSLANLRRFPLDTLKIDQSFVRDIPHDSAAKEIAATIAAMARALKLKVLAEGVETKGQFDFLATLGCDLFQGYLLSRPVAEDKMRQMLIGRNIALPLGEASA